MTNAGDCQRIGTIRLVACATIGLLSAISVRYVAAEDTAAAHFHERVQPILEKYCYACHSDGERKGGHAFDEFKSDKALVGDVKLWSAVLKNVRAGLMPPHGEERPAKDEQQRLFDWIELEVSRVDPADPDPGRVTLRRLNRVEYQNTIHDLMGIDYDTSDEFPADDSGYGFDNVGDALNVSTLLMEKYLNAAEAIVGEAVPTKEVDARLVTQYAKYQQIFLRGAAPSEPDERDSYAREILNAFARRAYRRPVDKETVDRLAALAKSAYKSPGQTFEAGIGRAIVAVLSSPRFLFRVENVAAASNGQRFPEIDEYALASRLSYFLWSTMPDDELMELAERGKLRAKLAAQVERMITDPRSKALSDNFAGQWLRARDIEGMEIEPIGALGLAREWSGYSENYGGRGTIVGRRRRSSDEEKASDTKNSDKADTSEGKKEDPKQETRWQERDKIRAEHKRLVKLTTMFSAELRRAMRDETLACFDYVVRENRDVTELIDSNYTFVNETLAKHYGIEGVKGTRRDASSCRQVARGGMLTQGTVLGVTSNPSRTSPVKRGLFILNNILGSPPPPPPPPNVPILEVAIDSILNRQPTIRESQELHRREPLCASCHARMDPLGLALENFNAMGMWRETEQERPIDASGELMTGEQFSGIRELKAIIKDKHRLDFYRCLSEKLLTYALGRGLEYYDEHTVDLIVAKLDRGQGKCLALLTPGLLSRHRSRSSGGQM